MRLIDLLEVLSDSMVVRVFRFVNCLQLCVYDGKDSIDEKYNDCKVEKITHTTKGLHIYISD